MMSPIGFTGSPKCVIVSSLDQLHTEVLSVSLFFQRYRILKRFLVISGFILLAIIFYRSVLHFISLSVHLSGSNC